MTTGPDNRRVPAWQGFRRLSSVVSTFNYVFSGVDLHSRTWSGKVRKTLESTTAEAVIVSVSAAYAAGDTTVTVSLAAADLDALVGNNAEWQGWLGVSCTGSPAYGLDGEILIGNVVNR